MVVGFTTVLEELAGGDTGVLYAKPGDIMSVPSAPVMYRCGGLNLVNWVFSGEMN